MADIEERQYWEQYMQAYEKCLAPQAPTHSPWYCVPADDKHNARLIVSHIVLDTLRSLKMSYPETTEDRRRELLEGPRTAHPVTTSHLTSARRAAFPRSDH